jgi:hypothetical protein
MRAGVAIALVASTLLAPFLARPARAYVRATNDTGAPLYWPTSCAAATVYLNGFSTMTSDEVAKAVAAAAHAWSPSEVACPGPDGDGGSGHPYFEIVPSLSLSGPAPSVAYDGKNSIIFQTASWDQPPELIAFTAHFSRPDGQIVDTDMEVNAAPNAEIIWANLDSGSPPPTHGQVRIDLQTALTHEFGHFIGLAHTCVHIGFDSPAAPDDDQGQPVAECPDVPPCPPGDTPQQQSVMWFNVCAESIAKRVLTSDDARAVCDIYPAAQDPHACSSNLPDDGCGCATGGAAQWAKVASLTLLALGMAVTQARQRRGLRPDRARRAAP